MYTFPVHPDQKTIDHEESLKEAFIQMMLVDDEKVADLVPSNKRIIF
jgi:hypothetical protein